MVKRRTFLAGAGAVLSTCVVPLRSFANDGLTAQLARVEAATGGRLGVTVLNERGAPLVSYRGNERFLMCSTFKVIAATAVLSRVDRGEEHLDRHIHFGKSDLLAYAPITSQNVRAGSMTVRALCEAALEYSDNTAGNLLLKLIGGPAGLTRYARSIGDSYTVLSRTEPSLNDALRQGEHRDTTTPDAMAKNLHTITFGHVLHEASRQELRTWMTASQTGGALLRAGVPTTWIVGDKSGLGGAMNAHNDSDTRNDIAFMQPPNAPPLTVAAFLTGASVSAADRDAALASVGRIVGQ